MPALSSGLYVVAAGQVDPAQGHYYVIYWPEESTWDESAASSVCRNRVMFMRYGFEDRPTLFERLMVMDRYLTKTCDQVIALLSTTHTASFKLVCGNEDSDSGSIDIDSDDEDRLFRYEVAKRIEQEECAALRPGFKVILSPIIPDCTSDLLKVNSQHISRCIPPADCPVNSLIFVPNLLHGETAQGFWKASYVPQKTRSISLSQHPYSKEHLKRLL
jgi:hypothetical protein